MSEAITRLNPESLPDAGAVGYSQISIAEPGRIAFVSGQVAWRRDGGAVPGNLAEQTSVVLENLGAALKALRAGPQDILQMRIYLVGLTDDRQRTVMEGLAVFLAGAKPSLTGLGVAALAAPDLQLEIEMTVLSPKLGVPDDASQSSADFRVPSMFSG